MIVSVIGAGKMGLPLSSQLAARGATVHACDTNPDRVQAINRGRCPIDEPGLPDLLSLGVESGRLTATSDTVAAVRRSDVVVVIVPCLLTEDMRADLSILEGVTRQIAQGLHEGILVSYETTVPVGTTRQRFLPLLAENGRQVGRDFYLAFSPERVKSGLAIHRLTKTPKVVGGAEDASTQMAAAFYKKWLGCPVCQVDSLEAAEMTKLAGMIYRDVNIALSNQLARYAEGVGVDFSRLIDAANTNGEASLLLPGIGVGGHCAPVYPYFVIHDARSRGVGVTLAEGARRINDGQADHMVGRLEAVIGSLAGKDILILGLGFRPGIKEHTCSPAFLIQKELVSRGAKVRLHDDLYTTEELKGHGFEAGGLACDAAPEAIILNTAHPAYRGLDFAASAAKGLKAVVDGRNLWDPEEVRRCGVAYVGVGRP